MHKLKWLASLCSFDLGAVLVVTPPQLLTGDAPEAAATAAEHAQRAGASPVSQESASSASRT